MRRVPREYSLHYDTHIHAPTLFKSFAFSYLLSYLIGITIACIIGDVHPVPCMVKVSRETYSVNVGTSHPVCIILQNVC